MTDADKVTPDILAFRLRVFTRSFQELVNKRRREQRAAMPLEAQKAMQFQDNDRKKAAYYAAHPNAKFAEPLEFGPCGEHCNCKRCNSARVLSSGMASYSSSSAPSSDSSTSSSSSSSSASSTSAASTPSSAPSAELSFDERRRLAYEARIAKLEATPTIFYHPQGDTTNLRANASANDAGNACHRNKCRRSALMDSIVFVFYAHQTSFAMSRDQPATSAANASAKCSGTCACGDRSLTNLCSNGEASTG